MAGSILFELEKGILKLLTKKRSMVVFTCGAGGLPEKVNYVLDRGFVFLAPHGSGILEAARKGATASFAIETGNPQVVINGSGALQLLGSPAEHDRERGLLLSKVPQTALLLEDSELVRLTPGLLSVVDIRGEPKAYSFSPSPEELAERPPLALVRALRPWSFQMSVSAFVLGILLARRFSLLIIPALIALMMAHGAFNMLSDYMDYRLRVDSPLGMGSSGSRVLVDRWLTPSFHLRYSLALLAGSVAIAAYLIALAPQILPAVAIGAAAGVLYALPRFGLKSNALGDLGVFIAFGPGIVLGSILLVGARPTAADVLVSFGIGMVIVAVLHANNWRDIRSDLAAGVKTLAALLGERGSKYYYLGLIWLSYAAFAAAVMLDPLDWPVLGSLLTVPWAVRLTKIALNERDWNRKVLDVRTGFFTALHMYFTIAFLAAAIALRLI